MDDEMPHLCCVKNWTQDFSHARKAIYQCSELPSPSVCLNSSICQLPWESGFTCEVAAPWPFWVDRMASLDMQFDTFGKGSGECSHHGLQETDSPKSVLWGLVKEGNWGSPHWQAPWRIQQKSYQPKKKHLFLLSQQYVSTPTGEGYQTESVTQPLLR